MIAGVIDDLTEHPSVYNTIQDLAGRASMISILRPWLDQLHGRVLDVGGGTGRFGTDMPPGVQYICLDECRRKLPSGSVCADATALPFATGSLDGALLIGVTHHLNDEALASTLAEISRVLVPRGRLLLVDAVRSARVLGRVLWRIDRGNHPRSASALGQAVSRYQVQGFTTFALLHDYVGWFLQT